MLPAIVVAADSVRRLSVAIVLLTSSFNKTLTRSEIARVHEEVAEFYAFYQQHGAGKVDFDFSLIEIDRTLARREIAEVSPGRYYLSRDNLAAELEARGFRGRFDEVIALHAWSNANPDRALQAYGGGAVGPDGQFLGDAGFNSIPVMGRDPNTIGQVLIHEVLHNIDDMFSRSGMPEEFFNSDEMSRNMPQLLRERPGAFLPLYTDSAMLAFADRERQGREGYPWRMQLVYYGWMLERTPKAAWDRLRYGRMVPRETRATRPLYSTIYTSAANDSVYVPELGRTRLPPHRFTQADFDGTPIYTGAFGAAWLPLAAADTQMAGLSRVVRQRVASVLVPPDIVQYLDAGPPTGIGARVVRDRCCGEPPELAGAALAIAGDTSHVAPHDADLSITATAPGWYVHPALTRLVVRRSWRVADDGPLAVTVGSPLVLNALVREDRGRDDVTVSGTVAGVPIRLERTGEGRYSATVADELAPGMHWARFAARAPDGTVVGDSVRVYVRAAGWIRVPDAYARAGDGRTTVTAALWSRMGVQVRHPVPLVAIVGDRVAPLGWDSAEARYGVTLTVPRRAEQVVVASLAGEVQRRLVPVRDTTVVPAPAPEATAGVPPFAAAVRLARAPVVDADAGDWPATVARDVVVDLHSFLLTDPSVYHGDSDLSARIRFGWDDSTLYVAGDITDDSVTSGEAWDVDRVNLVFDMAGNTTPLTYTSENPPLDQWQDDDYWLFWRFGSEVVRRFGKTNADPVPGARLATRRTDTGWAFEVAIPRSQLPGYVPFVGQKAGLQVFVTDGDGDRTATELMWSARWSYTGDGLEWHLAELATLLLVDAPLP